MAGTVADGDISFDARDHSRFGVKGQAQEVLAQVDPDIYGMLAVEVISQQRRSLTRQLARLEEARILEIETYCRITG